MSPPLGTQPALPLACPQAKGESLGAGEAQTPEILIPSLGGGMEVRFCMSHTLPG